MLSPVAIIEPADWMVQPETKAVMEALNARCGTNPGSAAEAGALFVGGCVRNVVLGRLVNDIDIATRYKPETVMEILKAADIKVIPTGLDHGTVTAVMRKKVFEITSLRKDIETDGRHAVVEFTDDWRADAERRDFTMNTLLADMAGNIYDPLEQGWNDLQMRKVIFVGAAEDRIAEDYLRILRFFRFHAGYGEGAPDRAALEACRTAADKIEKLSKERITQEVLRLIGYPDPQPTLDLMFENNVLSDLPAAGYDPATLAMTCRLQEDYDSGSIMARLVVLAAFRAGHMNRIEKYLVLSNAQVREFQTVIEAVSDRKSVV